MICDLFFLPFSVVNSSGDFPLHCQICERKARHATDGHFRPFVLSRFSQSVIFAGHLENDDAFLFNIICHFDIDHKNTFSFLQFPSRQTLPAPRHCLQRQLQMKAIATWRATWRRFLNHRHSLQYMNSFLKKICMRIEVH